MVGSCNGLVCYLALCKSAFGYYYDPIYISNPITGEYVYLPTFNFFKPVEGYFSCGFGYHHSTNEYKVVRIFREFFISHNCCSYVQVYTLGSGRGWRDIGRVDLRLSPEAGVCANGTLHWFEKHDKQIVDFDLAEEKFELISLPTLFPTVSYYSCPDTFLKLLGGYMCVVHTDDAGKEDRFIHILEKKKKYIKKQHEFKYVWSWRKTFSIPCSYAVRYTPFAVTKSNQVLMSHNRSVFYYSENTNVA
ncbi:F-box protein At3g07870-like [Papaver somniferum]|uniref:F-box protein At3g07870-like n=1 Tax=Papaver somniferum TaxID=3469 RepID=UPI000E705A7C|nr:F-box protein At3g07870-like [Papaver somniferum]